MTANGTAARRVPCYVPQRRARPDGGRRRQAGGRAVKSGPPAVVYTSRRGPAPIRHGACTQPQAGRSRRLRLRRLRRAPRTPEAATSRSKAALRSRASPGDPGLRRARDWRVAAARLLCSYRPSTRGLASASAQAAALEPRRRRGGGPGRLGKTAAAEQSAADCWRSSRSDGRGGAAAALLGICPGLSRAPVVCLGRLISGEVQCG